MTEAKPPEEAELYDWKRFAAEMVRVAFLHLAPLEVRFLEMTGCKSWCLPPLMIHYAKQRENQSGYIH